VIKANMRFDILAIILTHTRKRLDLAFDRSRPSEYFSELTKHGYKNLKEITRL